MGFGCRSSISEPNLPKDLKYTIVEDAKMIGRIKRSIVVLLNKKVDVKVLSKLARKLRNSDPVDYDKTFIRYLIDKEDSLGYWASSHFTPYLNVKILRPFIEGSEKKLIESKFKSNGEIIGTWRSNQFELDFTESSTRFLFVEGRYFSESLLLSDSSETTILFEMEKIECGNERICFKARYGSSPFHHNAINSEGELEHWYQGKITSIDKSIK
ncbi:MAG: hypothetical protein DWQ06_03075 [Calditrichaeota bacterium]|nr:MAG: hypothetical protein DWQ06_03075 [Calditrichota bacterium]